MTEPSQTYTLDANGLPLTVHQDGVTMPADHSFARVNDYVHDTDRHFEELQGLALGVACEIDKLRAALAKQTAPAVKIDESVEFEKWRSEQIDVLDRNGYPDGAKAFYGLGSVQWSGWQARARLAAEQPDTVRVPVETLQHIHRDLDACQKVIWLAGCRPRGYGFDPAYVSDAQARLKEIEALLGKEVGHA